MRHIVITISFALFSCITNTENNVIKNEIKNEIKNKFGTTLLISDSLQLYDQSTNLIKDNKKLTLATFINGSCFSCVEDLVRWKDIIKRYPNLYNYKFYIHSVKDDVLTSFINRWKIDFPLYIDSTSNIARKNKISNIKLLQTFMIDSNNKIIFVGNPLYSRNAYNYLFHDSLPPKK